MVDVTPVEPQFFIQDRAPNGDDHYPTGSQWVDTTHALTYVNYGSIDEPNWVAGGGGGGGGIFLPVPNQYYATQALIPLSGAGTAQLDRLFAYPFNTHGHAISAVAFAVQTVVGSFARVGLYADLEGKPDALIVDAGQLDCGSSYGTLEIACPYDAPDWFWVAVAGQGVAPILSVFGAGFNPVAAQPDLPVVYPYTRLVPGGYSQDGISGALPDPWGSTFDLYNAWTGYAPYVKLAGLD